MSAATLSLVPFLTAAQILARLITVDGAGSGLDADTVDGVEAAAFVQLAGTQTITGNKAFTGTVSVVDNSFSITGSVDATKVAKFEVDGFTTATTRTLTLQNASYTLAGINLAQTFSAAQSIPDNLLLITGSSDATKVAKFEVDGLTTATTRTYTLPNADLVVAGSAAALTSGRVPFATTGGLLTDASNFTYSGSLLTLGATTGTHVISSTTASTTSTSGALTIAGGLGVVGSIYSAAVVTSTATVGALIAGSGGTAFSFNPSQSAFFASDNSGYLYTSNGTASQFSPLTTFFSTAAGVLVLQPRSSAARGMLIAAGSTTPTARIAVYGGTQGVEVLGNAATPSAGNDTALGSTLAVTGGTITTAVPNISATNTWNAAGVTFTGWKLNITDTASAAASLLLDLQVASASKFSVSKAGAVSTVSLTASALTSGRVTFASTAGLLTDASNFTYSGTALTLAATTATHVISSTTASSSTTTGALTIAGGLGVAGAVNIGGLASMNGASIVMSDATNSVTTNFTFGHSLSSGTVAAGFGTRVAVVADTNGGSSRPMGYMVYDWVVATDASRAARLTYFISDAAGDRSAFTMATNGAVPTIGFYRADGGVVQPTAGAITAGFTAGAGTNVVSGSTFTGNTGASAYTIGDIVRGLKNLGLLAS